jgi:hypothetical protein
VEALVADEAGRVAVVVGPEELLVRRVARSGRQLAGRGSSGAEVVQVLEAHGGSGGRLTLLLRSQLVELDDSAGGLGVVVASRGFHFLGLALHHLSLEPPELHAARVANSVVVGKVRCQARRRRRRRTKERP